MIKGDMKSSIKELRELSRQRSEIGDSIVKRLTSLGEELLDLSDEIDHATKANTVRK